MWVRSGVRHFEYVGLRRADPLAEPEPTDVWRSLQYQWRSLCGEVVHTLEQDTTGEHYQISARGWFKSPYRTRCTRGVRSTDGRYFAYVADVGSVDRRGSAVLVRTGAAG